MQVLVAEDDRIASAILAQTLRRWDLDVTVVADGGAAWRYLQAASTPTLAILDWMMPEVDGADVCRRVRREMPLANMYLVLLTSLEGRSHVIAGLEAGADDYLVKPFDPGELRARVHVGMRVLGLQEKLADRVSELQAALDNVKQLHGLLPICSYCKRIRGDDQYWQQVESYIADRSDAQFSHSICPPCYEKLERELDGDGMPFSGAGEHLTLDDPPPVFDPSVLDRHTDGDRELLLDVVSVFLEDCPSRVAAIRAAVEDADPARIRATAHALKGSAAYLGAAFVVDAAADLETMGFEGRIAETVAALDRLETAVAQFIPTLRRFSDRARASESAEE